MIVLLSVYANDVRDVLRSVMFSRLCVVASVSSLTMQRLVFSLSCDCLVSCLRVFLYFCARWHGNTENLTSPSSQPHKCATRCAFKLVRQTKGRFPKMGKKCFCRTMKFSPQNFSPQKPLALTGIQLQSRIKTTPKNKARGGLFALRECLLHLLGFGLRLV